MDTTSGISLQLSLDQLASIYQSEHLIEDFLKVLQHKACSEDLKWEIFGQIHLIQERNKHLKSILAYFDANFKVSSCTGIRGILQYGLKLIHQYKDEAAKDAVVIHALLLIHHFKLGVYNMVVAYFHACGLEAEACIIRKYVLEEEETIEALNSIHIVSHQVREVAQV